MATDVQVDNQRKALTEDSLAAYQNPVIASSAPAGKDAKGKAPLAKPPAKVDPKAPPITAVKDEAGDDEIMDALPKVNFSQPLKYDLTRAPVDANNSSLLPNLYLLTL
jgi:hypothetical protein